MLPRLRLKTAKHHDPVHGVQSTLRVSVHKHVLLRERRPRYAIYLYVTDASVKALHERLRNSPEYVHCFVVGRHSSSPNFQHSAVSFTS